MRPSRLFGFGLGSFGEGMESAVGGGNSSFLVLMIHGAMLAVGGRDRLTATCYDWLSLHDYAEHQCLY